MAHYTDIRDVEEYVGDRPFLWPHVQAGDTVDFGAWLITITEEGVNCDCGKAAFCPANVQTRK